MLREALTYPTRGESAERALLVGTTLAVAAGLFARLGALAPLALLPAALLSGYLLAVLRDPGDGPPPVGDVRRLLVDGVRALVVAVGALVLPAVVAAVTFGGALSRAASPNFVRTLSVLGAGTVAVLFALLALYLLPIALSSVAGARRVRAATDRTALRRTATDGAYFVRWSAALAVGGCAATLALSLASVGRFGELLALALTFYASLVVARLVGAAT